MIMGSEGFGWVRRMAAGGVWLEYLGRCKMLSVVS